MKVALGLSSVWLYLVVMVVFNSASQIRTQTSVFPPAITSTSLDLKDVENDADFTKNRGVPIFTNKEKSGPTTAITPTSGRVTLSKALESPAVTHTPLNLLTTQSTKRAFSSQPASPSLDGTPSVQSSKEPLLVSLSTASAPSTTGGSQDIARPTHQDAPSQLNVGGEDFQGSVRRSLDPLLAGLLSVFIVTSAVIFVVLFLKFRQQNSNPEFHRLQDLPMDDLMEDTPLSRYTY
ncbi:hypothetical protein WMY93_000513 [Mugilogobius chulae]|uniref:Uncharacterized protein n=1 Tax=Mugilogobius chulae TaxID=88201 RepID=A0AAW0QA97_9GOBI